MISRQKRIRHRFEYLLTKGIMRFIWLFPWRVAMLLADGLGLFIFKILKIRREVTEQNLRHAFPSKTRQERYEIARNTYRHFARMSFEVIRLARLKREEILSLGVLEDQSLYDEVKKTGKGSILLTGHFGNWELFGAFISQLGYPVSFLVKKQTNPLTDQLLHQFRARVGAEIIPLGPAVRGIIKGLRANRFVAMVADQDAGPGGMFINFFNRPSSTATGPAVLAIRSGAPVVFGYSVRQQNGKYRFISERIHVDYKKGLTEQNIRSFLKAYSSLLEKVIRAHPDHWFWMHRRWKTESEIGKHDIREEQP